MGHILRCISPIDGAVFAEREALSAEAARQAVDRARAAPGRVRPRPTGPHVLSGSVSIWCGPASPPWER